ncbi:MAG: hypothetical protein IPK57_16015 [Chitinophagaceae bacterium]|nr:hypothetical protein [Chitinophagaceae bacterium]
MKSKILLTAMAVSMLVYVLSSCYRNKEDILALPRVSFRSEVVPIVTAGPCGCHNAAVNVRAVLFSDPRINTIYYDAILARRSQFDAWVNGGTHPGGGSIDFAPNEKNIIKRWIEQGDPYDDGQGCTVSGALRYTTDILPIYNTSCKGSTCHGGIATALDYNKMVQYKTSLTTMMNSGGSQGHPGGALSSTTCTINKFKEWINQGQPQ